MATVIGAVSPAHADPSPQDRATAQTFFDRALALMKAGKWSEACPDLVESQRIDPALGTQFQLARCYEGQGRVASAWVQYVDVADSARAAGQLDKERAARARAEAVAMRLPKLKIDVASANAGAEVTRDGVAVPRIQWGVPLPVDPGLHTIKATAPGKLPFEASRSLKEGEVATLVVEALSPQPSTPPTAASTAPSTSDDTGVSRKQVAVMVGGAGAAALTVAVALGLVARSKQSSVGADCVGDRCDQAGVDARKSALGTATVGTVVGAVGALALAGGVVLWVTAPSAASGPSAATAYVAPTPLGFTAGGSF